MDSLAKLSEEMKLNEEKMNSFQALIYQVISEWKDYGSHSIEMQNSFKECFSELESKEKKWKLVQESVSQSFTKLDVRRIWVEHKFKELVKKEKLMKDLLQRIEEEELMLGKFKSFVDEKLKDVALKEKQFEGLFGELRLFQDQMGRREIELDARERELNKLKEELELREEILDLKLKLVSVRGRDEEENTGFSPTQSTLEGKRCRNLALSSKRILDADEQTNMEEESSSKRSKKSCVDGKDAGQVTADDPGKSGSGDIDENQVKATVVGTQNIIVLDNSESDTDSKENLLSIPISNPGSSGNHIENERLGSCFKFGQTWACYGGKDKIPRAYVQVLKVVNNGGITRLGVAWLKPLWGSLGEKKWIESGLPVGCGMFERERTSVEAANVFAHQVCCLEKAYNRYCILPGEGETWAMYNDWDILSWSSSAETHRRYKYEIVEILQYLTSGSTFFDIRVACLAKMRGSTNSFQRRRQDKNASFFIRSTDLFRFSHRVPSARKTCNFPDGFSDTTFDIEPESLPPGLC